jgi:hypothetical protein
MALAGEPAAAAPAAAAAVPDDEAGAAGVVDEDVELHAAAPMATLAAMPDTASTRRFFMASPWFGDPATSGDLSSSYRHTPYSQSRHSRIGPAPEFFMAASGASVPIQLPDDYEWEV